jgi:cytosine/uracil/thiamine/allantoin permease
MMGNAGNLKRRFAVKGSQQNSWLDNDDIRPLALKDRTWSAKTYFVFWFSAAATGEILQMMIYIVDF